MTPPSPTETAEDPINLLDEARRDRRSPSSAGQLGKLIRRETMQRLDEKAGVFRHDQPDEAGRKTMEYLAEDIVVVFDGPTPSGEERDFVKGDSSQQVTAVLVPTKPVPVGERPAREVLVARPGRFTTQGAEWEVQELPIPLVESAAELIGDQRDAPEPETVEAE